MFVRGRGEGEGEGEGVLIGNAGWLRLNRRRCGLCSPISPLVMIEFTHFFNLYLRDTNSSRTVLTLYLWQPVKCV